LKHHTNPAEFVKTVQGSLWGVYISKFGKISEKISIFEVPYPIIHQ